MKRYTIGFGWLMVACVAVAGTGKSNEFRVDTREGERLSAGTEELTFSNLWDGDKDATVTIRQNGAAVFEGLSGEGLKTWTVDRNGRYELTHTTYTNGVKGKVETAVFVVEGKEVPVGELTVEWETGSYKYDSNGKTPGVTAKDGDTLLVKGVDYTVRYEGNTNAGTAKAILTGLPPYVGSVTNEFAIAKRSVGLTSGTDSKAYDGTPLVCHSVTTNGEGFVTGEGVDFTFSGSQTISGSSKNTFDYAFKTGTLAGNYTIAKTEGDLNVTSGEIVNPFDPDDPYKPVSPEVLAKANCITNYDGDGHSIEVAAFLNPLIAANNPKITYSLLCDGTYEAKNPSFTNVVSTSVWYRIEADNFNLFTTNALLKILPRSITNADVAAIGDQTYTGSGIEPIPAVTDMRTLIGMSEPTDILSGEDYDLSYLNNMNVGTAKVVVSGKNNYEGALTNTFQIVPAIIPFGPDGAIVATGYTNAYDGAAHGVSVSATGLKTQPTVQYKGNPSAEWQDDSPTCTDVCDTQVWWMVSAPNYQSVEGTIGLKIRQAENVWTTEPAIDSWTYGETAKTPVGAAKFGEVTFAYSPMPVGPAGDYTMTATVAGTANYTGLSKTVGFSIAKATLPGGGEEPGGGTVPEGGVSKFDTVAMYDGEGHTIKTNELVAAFKAAVGGDVAVSYACGGAGVPALPWMAVAPDFTNVCETSVWYKVASANYRDFVHEAKLTITPRDIEKATVADIPDQEHTGTAIKPPVTVTDGNPTIITSDDYMVAYSDNITIGQATVTLTGKRNYTGTKTAHFMIKGSSAAALKAEIAWKLLKASGTYMAQLKVTCTSGLATGISNLRFMFADRVSGGTTFASLWDTPKRAAKSTTMPYSGDTYRYVALDASRITAENVAVTYGVSNFAATSIPTAERTIELYVRKRVNPTTGKEEAAGVDNFVGYVSWTSGGETSYLPVVAGAQAASLAKAALKAPTPMKLAAVNTALAVGSVIAEGSSPYCKLTEFAVGDNEITGVIEVGAVSGDGAEYPGKLGPNATVTLLGTNDLGLDFKEISSVTTDSAGRFRLAKPKDCQFFKLKLTVEEVVE